MVLTLKKMADFLFVIQQAQIFDEVSSIYSF